MHTDIIRYYLVIRYTAILYCVLNKFLAFFEGNFGIALVVFYDLCSTAARSPCPLDDIFRRYGCNRYTTCAAVGRPGTIIIGRTVKYTEWRWHGGRSRWLGVGNEGKCVRGRCGERFDGPSSPARCIRSAVCRYSLCVLAVVSFRLRCPIVTCAPFGSLSTYSLPPTRFFYVFCRVRFTEDLLRVVLGLRGGFNKL